MDRVNLWQLVSILPSLFLSFHTNTTVFKTIFLTLSLFILKRETQTNLLELKIADSLTERSSVISFRINSILHFIAFLPKEIWPDVDWPHQVIDSGMASCMVSQVLPRHPVFLFNSAWYDCGVGRCLALKGQTLCWQWMMLTFLLPQYLFLGFVPWFPCHWHERWYKIKEI